MKKINFVCPRCNKVCTQGSKTKTFADHVETTRGCANCNLAWRISYDETGAIQVLYQVKKQQTFGPKVTVTNEAAGITFEDVAPKTDEELLASLEKFFSIVKDE